MSVVYLALSLMLEFRLLWDSARGQISGAVGSYTPPAIAVAMVKGVGLVIVEVVGTVIVIGDLDSIAHYCHSKGWE